MRSLTALIPTASSPAGKPRPPIGVNEELLSADELKKILRYEPEEGNFYWLKRTRACNPSKPAGSRCGVGLRYVRITIAGKTYAAHRLAWLYMTGAWPAHEIDHRDRDSLNNRWPNLRDVARGPNQQNRVSADVDSQSGILGVFPRYGKWIAKIQADGQAHWLGTFATQEEARSVYLAAKRELHPGFIHEEASANV